jgi:peroxiredoxin (alkyl hydroperoxide reductase subunit C)
VHRRWLVFGLAAVAVVAADRLGCMIRVVGEAVMPVEVGVEAPDFTLKNQHRQDVRLSDFRSRTNVLLVFYPLAFTGICSDELDEVRDNLGDFENDEVQVLAVSVDSSASHKVWAERQGYTFPLLADFWPHGIVAQAYGVFNEISGCANRGTFLIDRGGIVRFAEMNAPGEPRDQDVWRKALATLASGAASGRGLPALWAASQPE